MSNKHKLFRRLESTRSTKKILASVHLYIPNDVNNMVSKLFPMKLYFRTIENKAYHDYEF